MRGVADIALSTLLILERETPPERIPLSNATPGRHSDNDFATSRMLLRWNSFYKEWIVRGKSLELPDNSHTALPRERIRALAFFGASSTSIEDFLRLGDRAGAIRSADASLRCVAS